MTTKSTRNLPYAGHISIDEQLNIQKMWPKSFNPMNPELSIGGSTIPLTQKQLEELTKHTNNTLAEEDKVKQAVKFDDGKVDWTLVPFEALEGMAEVLTFGAKKYAAWNWTDGGGFVWMRLIGSCLRHIFAWTRGEDLDPESGLSHISHAQCNLLFLSYYIRNKDKFNKDNRNVR